MAAGQFPASAELSKSLDRSLADIKDLEKELDPGKGDRFMKRISKRALKWPFSKKEVNQRVSRLQGFKATLSLALLTDQTYDFQICAATFQANE